MYVLKPQNLRLAAAAIACLVSTAWSTPIPGGYQSWRHHKRPHCEDPRQRNFDTVSEIYNLTVYPNPLQIFGLGAAGVPPGLFSQNVTGRVDPVGTFGDFEDSIEYFFALAPTPQTLGLAITRYKITEFVSACAEVAASVVWLFPSVVRPGSPDDGKVVAPLKQIAFWRFDSEGAVIAYDAVIPNLQNWVANGTGVSPENPQYQAGSIQQICATTQQRCVGPNQQYASFDECVSCLSAKPFGNYDEAWGDNLVCRSIHVILTGVRPDVHCPHVGPTGGGKCIDVPYGVDYFTDEDLFDAPLGETFMCPK